MRALLCDTDQLRGSPTDLTKARGTGGFWKSRGLWWDQWDFPETDLRHATEPEKTVSNPIITCHHVGLQTNNCTHNRVDNYVIIAILMMCWWILGLFIFICFYFLFVFPCPKSWPIRYLEIRPRLVEDKICPRPVEDGFQGIWLVEKIADGTWACWVEILLTTMIL